MKHNGNKNLIDSFKNAGRGVAYALKNERNFRIYMVFLTGVLALSLFFGVDRGEAADLAFASALVIWTELINTSIEALTDLYCGEKKHPLAKIAKDCAAGAVLVCAINAVFTGYTVFFHKIIDFIVS